jgi:uncharacterized tellurite resistance protein B-like protein
MAILDRIRTFLDGEGSLTRDASGEYADIDLWVGTAVLLLELAYGDTEYVPKEQRLIRRSIEREFGILPHDARELLKRAEAARTRHDAVSRVAERIRQGYDEEQRKRIIALLWKVVHADGEVAGFETVFTDHVTQLAGLTPEQGREARLMAERGEV